VEETIIKRVRKKKIFLLQEMENIKPRKSQECGKTSKGGKKCDMRKVECFSCHKPRHYSSQFPTKKKEKKNPQTTTPSDIDEFSSMFDEDFSLIACLSSSGTKATGLWYIDSGVSYHLKGFREYFSNFIEDDMDFDIEMGNNSKCTSVGQGIVTFQRESGKTFSFTNVFFIPGMKKNLISVSVLRDRRYDVLFRGLKVYIHLNGSK
jgi:hypothetical protein